MTQCPKCGAPNAPEANFCSNCGEALSRADAAVSPDTTRVIPTVVDDPGVSDELTPEDVAAVEALPQSSALLIVQRGPGSGQRYLLDTDEVMAGRHPDCDIFLDDITVSRHHMKFVRNGQQFSVVDLGSLNGTYVNRTLIDGEVSLRPGDEVQIGKFRMVFYANGPGQA